MAAQQLTLATQVDTGFALHRKPTRRDVFLAEMVGNSGVARS